MEEVILQAESAGSLQQYEEVVDATDDLGDVYGVSHLNSDIYIQDELPSGPSSNHHHHHHHSSIGLHLALPDSQTLGAVSTTTGSGGGKRKGNNSLVRFVQKQNYTHLLRC